MSPLSWHPASAGNGHGAKLPKNPMHITISRQNGLISHSRWRKERRAMGTARLKARTGESVEIRFATYWSATPGGGGVAYTMAKDIHIAERATRPSSSRLGAGQGARGKHLWGVSRVPCDVGAVGRALLCRTPGRPTCYCHNKSWTRATVKRTENRSPAQPWGGP